MSRVLIIGPKYFNFLTATASAFGTFGWETVVESYDNPIHPYTIVMKWRWKLSGRRADLQRRSREAYKAHIESRFAEEKPDLVFILNGDILLPETLDIFRKSAKVALWLYDNIERLPSSIALAGHADALFTFESEDCQAFLNDGKQAWFLPQACDTSVYRPLGLEKDIDILFVGNLWNSPRRKDLMLKVIEAFPGKRIEVYGLYQPWYKGIIKWLRRPYKNIFRNRMISPEKVNELYNRSKVVLNIHQELQAFGANPRVFEICGSGSFQICDANPYVMRLFPNGEIGFYTTAAELAEEISAALGSDTSARAAAAHAEVVKEHTFIQRIETVLHTIYG